MKIGIDLRAMDRGSSASHRGIGRYGTELLEALSHIDHKNEYVFFVSHPKALPPELKLNAEFKHEHRTGKEEGLRGVKYIRIIYLLPRSLSIDKLGLDVFLQLDPFTPVKARKTPIVSVLYDLIPFLYKEQYQHVHLGGYTPGHLIGYSRMKIKWKLLEKQLYKYKRSERVVSISEHSKKDLVAFVPNLDPKRIDVTPLGPGSSKTKPQASKQLSPLKNKRFLFYLGGVDPRKGLVAFTKEMEQIWEKHPETMVVFAGKEIVDYEVPEARKLRDTIKNSSRSKQILTFGFVTDGEMYWLYENAAAFIFPSRYEGFGLPVLEAMMSGSPVITYRNSSIPEVAGDATLLVEDGESLVPAVNKLLSSKTLREKMVKAGKKQAALFTWEKTAKATLKTLEKAAKAKR